MPHHATQHGNRRQPTFLGDEDYAAFFFSSSYAIPLWNDWQSLPNTGDPMWPDLPYGLVEVVPEPATLLLLAAAAPVLLRRRGRRSKSNPARRHSARLAG